MAVKTDGVMTNVSRQNDIVIVSLHHLSNMGKNLHCLGTMFQLRTN